MDIQDITIIKTPGKTEWGLDITACGHRFTGFFDNMVTFAHAAGDALKYFGLACGVLKRNDTNGALYNVKKGMR